MITYADIESASRVIRAVANKTPLLSSRTFNARNGNQVFFKAENLQRIGAFKFRGAYNKIASLSDAQKKNGVVAHSSGNHAQGVALAARIFGIKAVIVMPKGSVESKVEATQGYGAEVVFCGPLIDDRERATDELIRQHGYTLIHPYHDEKIIAGQGTLVPEVFEVQTHLDYLFVPIGGGGLISGCAVAAKHLYPSIKVVGVETDGANDAYMSFREKRIVRIPKAETIADGMRTNSVGELNFEIISRFVDDVITIPDEDIFPMMKFFLERMKILVEPTGAVASAAVARNALRLSGKSICAVISGGNVDAELLKKIL